MEAALNGAPLEATLGVLVRTAAHTLGTYARSAFYLADDEGTSLHHVVGMPAEYANKVNGFQCEPESSACSLATHMDKRVLTNDIMKDSRWEKWRWLAERYDYRDFWSFPIYSPARRLVGTFAVFWQQPHEATQRELELVELLTHTAAIMISQFHETENRIRIETALRENEECVGRNGNPAT